MFPELEIVSGGWPQWIELHSTIARYHELLVVAVSRYNGACLLASLNESGSRYTEVMMLLFK